MKRSLRLMAWVLIASVLLLLQACDNQPAGISVGADAPDFTLPAADGEQVSLSDYAGQPVLLYFHMAMG